MNQRPTKQWKEPKLVVLVRGRPQDGVLQTLKHCKTESAGTFDGTIAQHCGTVNAGNCATCHDRGGGNS